MRKTALITALILALTTGVCSAQTPVAPRNSRQPLNIVLLVIDDVRWDSLGATGNRIVRTPRIDRLAKDGVRFEQARVTTSICMVSRATLLTGQYMSRHGITAFGRQIAPDAFASTFPGVLRRAGYWTGHVGKYGIGRPRDEDFDFLRAYEGTHWMTGSTGERIHVTEKNARDSIDFLQTRPKDQPFSLAVGFFAAHAQDNAPEQYLPQDWSAQFDQGVKVPPPLRGDPKYLAALPPFLSNEANEGRVRYHWRFDTPESYQAYMTRYYRLITEVDAAVGRIVDELQTQGAYDNTGDAAAGLARRILLRAPDRNEQGPHSIVQSCRWQGVEVRRVARVRLPAAFRPEERFRGATQPCWKSGARDTAEEDAAAARRMASARPVKRTWLKT